jgi:ABC-type antimicrobial peptide transport system permease subunit
VRSLLVVVLLAAGISFALTSVALAIAAGDQIDKIKLTTGVEAGVSISPQQFQQAILAEAERAQAEDEEFDRSRINELIEPLTAEHAEAIAALPYVRGVQVFTIAAVEYDLPGVEEEEEGESEEEETPAGGGPAGQGNNLPTPIGNISLPDAIITGTEEAAFVADFRSGSKELTEGRLFDTDDAGSKVVVIDQNTATLEELAIGDFIVLKAQIPPEEGEESEEPEFWEVEAEIIGVYQDLETATQGGFGRVSIAAWYAPIGVVRELQDPEEAEVLSAISLVYASVDDAAQLRTDVEGMLDPDLFTLTTSEERFEDISDPLETMRSTSLLVMAAGLAVVGLIMVMLMALVVRGRLREIGILKAVGARNRQVILQFALETVGISIVAVALALPAVFATNTFLPELIRPAAEVEEVAQDGPGFGPGARALVNAPISDDPVRTEEIEEVLNQVDASVSVEVIGIAAVIAIGLGLLGALVPIVTVLRLRPAEVLRLEA